MEGNGSIPPGQRTTTGLQHTMKHFSCKLQLLTLTYFLRGVDKFDIRWSNFGTAGPATFY